MRGKSSRFARSRQSNGLPVFKSHTFYDKNPIIEYVEYPTEQDELSKLLGLKQPHWIGTIEFSPKEQAVVRQIAAANLNQVGQYWYATMLAMGNDILEFPIRYPHKQNALSANNNLRSLIRMLNQSHLTIPQHSAKESLNLRKKIIKPFLHPNTQVNTTWDNNIGTFNTLEMLAILILAPKHWQRTVTNEQRVHAQKLADLNDTEGKRLANMQLNWQLLMTRVSADIVENRHDDNLDKTAFLLAEHLFTHYDCEVLPDEYKWNETKELLNHIVNDCKLDKHADGNLQFLFSILENKLKKSNL